MAQVTLTFDDGLAEHYDAAAYLATKDLVGAFAVVTDRLDEPGFLTRPQLKHMTNVWGHTVINHSSAHPWSGGGQEKQGQTSHELDELTADYLSARDELNKEGYDGGIFSVPYGTTNILGEEHLASLLPEFDLIRMTIGAPIPEEFGQWTPIGGKRLYQKNYSNKVIGISAAADVRWPDEITETVDAAIETDSLAVLLWHKTCHVSGSGMDVMWKRFKSDIDYIAGKVEAGLIDCVEIDSLVKERVEA